MKFSVNWLREFVDLPEKPEYIADLLTRAGIETKDVETRGANIDKVIVSQITASSRHPNADRLTVCEVEDGSGTKRRQITPPATNRTRFICLMVDFCEPTLPPCRSARWNWRRLRFA